VQIDLLLELYFAVVLLVEFVVEVEAQSLRFLLGFDNKLEQLEMLLQTVQ